MNISQLYDYCLAKKEVSEGFPFDKNVLVFKVLGKIFLLTPLDKWESGEAFINLKCDPEYAQELRSEYESIKPGYHMNKSHWNSVYLHENELSQDLIFKLIDHSYSCVFKSLPKSKRDILNNQD